MSTLALRPACWHRVVKGYCIVATVAELVVHPLCILFIEKQEKKDYQDKKIEQECNSHDFRWCKHLAQVDLLSVKPKDNRTGHYDNRSHLSPDNPWVRRLETHLNNVSEVRGAVLETEGTRDDKVNKFE